MNEKTHSNFFLFIRHFFFRQETINTFSFHLNEYFFEYDYEYFRFVFTFILYYLYISVQACKRKQNL